MFFNSVFTENFYISDHQGELASLLSLHIRVLIKAFGSVPCVSVLSNNLRSIGLKSLKVWFDFEQNPLDFFLWGGDF